MSWSSSSYLYWASYGAFSAAQFNIINFKGGEAAALAQQRRQLQQERQRLEAQLAKQQQAQADYNSFD